AVKAHPGRSRARGLAASPRGKELRNEENVFVHSEGDGSIFGPLPGSSIGVLSDAIFRVQSPAGETTAAPGPTHPKRGSTEHRRAEREGAVLCRRHCPRHQVGARWNIRKIEPGRDSNEPAGF